jgi:hypothetical protein
MATSRVIPPILPPRESKIAHRIVQYKMILKPDLIPIQDDPENDSKAPMCACPLG